MKLPNGTILMHEKAPYDPVKAHEYYLRTRKLKGRKKGTSYTVKLGSGKTIRLTGRQLAEQKAYAAERVSTIKRRLVELNSKLRVAMREAEAKKAKSKREASKPESAADKAKAARESKKYRDKHQQELASKRKKASTTDKRTVTADPVAQLEAKISVIRDTLKTVIARQRALAGATRNN